MMAALRMCTMLVVVVWHRSDCPEQCVLNTLQSVFACALHLL
jgi:hypothetical protein